MAVTAEEQALQLPEPPPSGPIWSDEPPMESTLHYAQLALLVACLERLWRDRQDYFIGANLSVYFSLAELSRRQFRGPDFFLVRGVEKRPRASWVVWEEGGRYPDLIIELLSESTAATDRTAKRALYQDVFRTPEYFWFSPETLEFMGLRLEGGRYLEIPADEHGRRWSRVLELSLGIHEGQLRYFTEAGDLVPTPQEAEEEQRRRAEALAARLRELGVDPDQIAP